MGISEYCKTVQINLENQSLPFGHTVKKTYCQQL